MQVVPTIICGGTGSRLWPVSRAHRPKPFMKLGNDGRSFPQQTFLRARHCDPLDQEIVNTGDGALTLIVVDQNSRNGPIP